MERLSSRRTWWEAGPAGAAILASLVLLADLGGCSKADTGRPRVVVTIAPLAGLVKPLLPEGADVRVMIPPGRSEHGYEMTAADVQALARADLVVMVGLGLDGQVAGYLKGHPVKGREEVVFADAVGVAAAPGQAHEEHVHADHDDEDEHEHGGVDPHVWLDPKLVERGVPALAAGVRAAEKQIGPVSDAEKTRLDAAEAKLLADVRAVDDEYRTKLGPLAGKAIVTHHAAWARLADRYGLKVVAVIRPIEGSEPTAAAVTAAVHAIEDQHVPVVFVEPQFSAQAAERIATLARVRVAKLDPLGDGDWFAMMRANLESLVKNLSP
jgi:zinc transport system substrate-binding protein